MKKNIKFDKNNLFYVLLTTVLLSVVSITASLSFGLTSYNKLVQVQKEDSLVNQTTTKYTVYGLNDEQKASFESLDSVDGVSLYTEYNAKFEFKDSTINNVNLLLFENFDSLENTPYTEDKLIQKSNKSYEHGVYFCYDFAKTNNIKLDDEIVIPFKNPLKCNVSAIYERNYINGDNSIILSYKDNKSFLDANLSEIEFLMSYIKVNDTQAFETYYKNNYKPLGLLRDQSEFENNIEYERYLDRFNNTDYNTKSYINKYVVEYKTNVGELKNNLNTTMIVILATSTLIILVFGILAGVLFNKKVKTVKLFTNQKTPYITSSYILGGMNVLISCLIYLLIPVFIIKSNISYVSYSLYISYILPILITNVIAIIIAALVNILVTSKIMKAKKIELKKEEEKNTLKTEKKEIDKN